MKTKALQTGKYLWRKHSLSKWFSVFVRRKYLQVAVEHLRPSSRNIFEAVSATFCFHSKVAFERK